MNAYTRNPGAFHVIAEMSFPDPFCAKKRDHNNNWFYPFFTGTEFRRSAVVAAVPWATRDINNKKIVEPSVWLKHKKTARNFFPNGSSHRCHALILRRHPFSCSTRNTFPVCLFGCPQMPAWKVWKNKYNKSVPFLTIASLWTKLQLGVKTFWLSFLGVENISLQ